MFIDNLSPLQFILDHLQHLGWSTVVVSAVTLTWKISRLITKREEEWSAMHKSTTNFLPHAINDMAVSLRILSRREDIRPGEFEQGEK